MVGYSGTPFPKKLGIKDGHNVCLVDAPKEVYAELNSALATCNIRRDSKIPLDFAVVFTTSRARLVKEFKRLTRQLAPGGMLWVSWPKKSSGVATDLDENIVREI